MLRPIWRRHKNSWNTDVKLFVPLFLSKPRGRSKSSPCLGKNHHTTGPHSSSQNTVKTACFFDKSGTQKLPHLQHLGQCIQTKHTDRMHLLIWQTQSKPTLFDSRDLLFTNQPPTTRRNRPSTTKKGGTLVFWDLMLLLLRKQTMTTTLKGWDPILQRLSSTISICQRITWQPISTAKKKKTPIITAQTPAKTCRMTFGFIKTSLTSSWCLGHKYYLLLVFYQTTMESHHPLMHYWVPFQNIQIMSRICDYGQQQKSKKSKRWGYSSLTPTTIHGISQATLVLTQQFFNEHTPEPMSLLEIGRN